MRGVQLQVVYGKMLGKFRSKQYECHSLLSTATEDSKYVKRNIVIARAAWLSCDKIGNDTGEYLNFGELSSNNIHADCCEEET